MNVNMNALPGSPARTPYRKAEEEKLIRDRDELIRQEKMAAMEIKRETDTFWVIPDDTIVATSDKFFVDPEVLQVIDDLDNELVGLQPVSHFYLITCIRPLFAQFIFMFIFRLRTS